MYPAYRWTDSYPHHTNPLHYPPNHDPRAKEIDRGTMNSPYHPWPYTSPHCYPMPQSCHSCCNHSYFGGPYTFTSPYPHYPPPPPFHSHGFYPPFPGAHPAYSYPPPHYSMEQPRYDYDKNTPTPHHCCGCEKKSNIEPQEPEVDKKPSESLVPFLKNYPNLSPIMWAPPSYTNTESKVKEKEKEKPLEPSKEEENDKMDGDRFPFPIFWLPFKNDEVKKDNLDEKTKRNDEVESEIEKSSKHGGEKVIPVIQGDAKEEKKKTENGKEEKKVSQSQKSSKLPPVCLRIDPLPKKKNTSRSPSPPGDKERLKRSKVEDSKSSKQQTELHSDGKEVEKEMVVDFKVDSKVEKKKRSLSENEAAVMIQSVYRGFEVRKSQPLMKLRQICEVGKQVAELRNRVRDLESSMDNKQKLVIGETIMSLLLKLDTIQGLHPVVRDVRKSVAKELVSLQEKIDSLTFVNSETLSEEKNHESEAKNDDGEIRNADVEPQVESQNENDAGEVPTMVEPEQPVKDSVDHEKAQSDSKEAAVDLAHDKKTEHEQGSDELNNDQVQMAMETEQPGDDVIEDADPARDMKTVHLVELDSGELNDDQVQMAVETDQPVDDVIQANSDQVLSNSMDVETNLEVTDNQLGMVEEVEPAEKPDQTQKTLDSMEDSTTATVEVETEELGKEGVGNRVEEDLVEVPMVDDGGSSDQTQKTLDSMEDLNTATVEVETTELGKEGVEEGLMEAPMVDDVDGESKEVLMEDIGGGPAVSAHVSSGGDKKVVEENEKLRAAVEELMKAGSEQVSVIRELTGRVKDLEKELVKKKRRKVKKSSRRPRSSVVEEF